MPKRVFPQNNWQPEPLDYTCWVTRNAPFGTNYTPDTARLRIVDGKMVSVNDSNGYYTSYSVSPEGHVPPHSLAPATQEEYQDESNVATRNFSSSSSSQTGRRNGYGSPSGLESMEGQNDRNGLGGQNGHNRMTRPDDVTRQNGNGNHFQETNRQSIHRHRILPPIALENERSNDTDAAAEKDLFILGGGGNPDRSEKLTRSEELEALSKRIREELTSFSTHQLKYIYLKLTDADKHSTGYVPFSEIESTFRQSRVDLSPAILRLTASMFLSVYKSNQVNYEGLLSFIAKSFKADSTPREVNGAGALRAMIKAELLAGGCAMEFEKIWNFFQRADISRRDCFSREQIKRLVAACHLPLSEFVVDQVIDRCDVVSGQYSWQQFLSYIEHVFPMKTSLNIPPTHQKVKHFRTVSSDWPELNSTPRSRNIDLPLDEELSKLGTIVQETRKKLSEEKREGSYVFKPWFERFMNMAKAVYSFDPTKSGYMNILVTRWLIQEYNDVYNLELDLAKLETALKRYCNDGNRVAFEPLLKLLITPGP